VSEFGAKRGWSMSRVRKIFLGVVVVLITVAIWMFWPESADVDGIGPPAGTYDSVIRRDTYWRITGILGILFFVGIAIGIFGLTYPIQPNPNDPIAEIRHFFANDSAAIHTANWIVGVTLMFVFLPVPVSHH
jgi:hypothetical protein